MPRTYSYEKAEVPSLDWNISSLHDAVSANALDERMQALEAERAAYREGQGGSSADTSKPTSARRSGPPHSFKLKLPDVSSKFSNGQQTPPAPGKKSALRTNRKKSGSKTERTHSRTEEPFCVVVDGECQTSRPVTRAKTPGRGSRNTVDIFQTQVAEMACQTMLNYSAAANTHVVEAPSMIPPGRTDVSVFCSPRLTIPSNMSRHGSNYGRRLRDQHIGELAIQSARTSRARLASDVVRVHDKLANFAVSKTRSEMIVAARAQDDGLNGASGRVVANVKMDRGSDDVALSKYTFVPAKVPCVSIGVQAAPMGYTRFYFSDVAIDRAIAPVLASGISPGIAALHPDVLAARPSMLVGGRSNDASAGINVGPWFYMHFDVRMLAPEELNWLPVVPSKIIGVDRDEKRPVYSGALEDVPEWVQDDYDRLHFASLEMHAGENPAAGGWPAAPLERRSQVVAEAGAYLCCADESPEQRMNLVKVCRYASMVMPRGREDALALIRLLGGLLATYITALEKADAIAIKMREHERNRVAQLMAENASLRDALDKMTLEKERLERSFEERLRAMESMWDAERSKLLAEISRLETERARYKDLAELNGNQNDELNDLLALLRAQLEAERKERARLEQLLANEQEQNGMFGSRLAVLQQEWEKAMKENAQLRSENAQLRSELDDALKRLAELMQQLKEAKEANEKGSQDQEALEQRLADLKRQLEDELAKRLEMLKRIQIHLDHIAETVHGARMLETLEDDEKTMRMEYELNIRHIIDGLRKSSLALGDSSATGKLGGGGAPRIEGGSETTTDDVTVVTDEAAFVRDILEKAGFDDPKTLHRPADANNALIDAMHRLTAWYSAYLADFNVTTKVYIEANVQSLTAESIAENVESQEVLASDKDADVKDHGHLDDRVPIRKTKDGVSVYAGEGDLEVLFTSTERVKGLKGLTPDEKRIPDCVTASLENAEERSMLNSKDEAEDVEEYSIPILRKDLNDFNGIAPFGSIYLCISRRVTDEVGTESAEQQPPSVQLPGPPTPYRPYAVTCKENQERLLVSLRMLSDFFGACLDHIEEQLLDRENLKALRQAELEADPLTSEIKDKFSKLIVSAAVRRQEIDNKLGFMRNSNKMNLMLTELRSYKKVSHATLCVISALYFTINPSNEKLWQFLDKEKSSKGKIKYAIPRKQNPENFKEEPSVKNLWTELVHELSKDDTSPPARTLASRIACTKFPSELPAGKGRDVAQLGIDFAREIMKDITKEQLRRASHALEIISFVLDSVWELNDVIAEIMGMKYSVLEGVAEEDKEKANEIFDHVMKEGEKMADEQRDQVAENIREALGVNFHEEANLPSNEVFKKKKKKKKKP